MQALSWPTLLQAFITAFLALFPVINPIGAGLMVSGLFKNLSDAERKTAARRVFFYCLLIGLGSLLAGHLILVLFGLAVPVIQVGGGIIICKTGWDWLGDGPVVSPELTGQGMKKEGLKALEKQLFYPIAFPLCMDPGSISVIFTLMATAHIKSNLVATGINYFVIVLAIVALLAILYPFLYQGGRITKRLGESGNVIINKLIAFLMFCIGIQIIVEGISKIFGLSVAL